MSGTGADPRPLELRSLNERLMTPGRPPRVLFCGSRDLTRADGYRLIEPRVVALPVGSLVIAGGARGADTIAADVARGYGYHVAEVMALWRRYGDAAGRERNAAMLSLLDAENDWVEAFLACASPGRTRGTGHTLGCAERAGIPANVFWLDGSRSAISGLRAGR
jgi:hypothetical protein